MTQNNPATLRLDEMLHDPSLPKPENAEKGVWQMLTERDSDGDELTIFFHTGTGVMVEVDHDYSDGGISCKASALEKEIMVRHAFL